MLHVAVRPSVCLSPAAVTAGCSKEESHVQPVPVSGHPVHGLPVAHTTPVPSPCMLPPNHAPCGNSLYCHPTHSPHRSVLTVWSCVLRPTSVGARHTPPIDVSVAEFSSPHRSPAAASTKNQHHVCRISRSCAMDAVRPCPARHWYVRPTALPSPRPGQRVVDAPQT